MRKTGILGIGILLAVLFATASFAEGLRVAVIDINKVLNQSEPGKSAKNKMEARYEELKKKVDAKQEEVRHLKEELDRQKVMLGKEKLKEKEDALQAKVGELRQLTQEGEQEMQTRQNEFTRKVLKVIEAEVGKVVKARKFDLVLERSAGVVYFNDSLDITQEVLDRVNRQAKEESGQSGSDAKKTPGKGTAKEPAAKTAPGTKKEGGGAK